MIGQTPINFQTPNGEWSVVSMLLAGFSGLAAIVVFLFRSRESEHSLQIGEMKVVIAELKISCKELQAKADECHNDRVALYGQMAELKIQVARVMKQ